MREFRFYREPSHRWYVDLPDWPGEKADLEMVSGADTMLDVLAQGEGEINLIISTESIPGALCLEFIMETPEIGEGAQYLFIDHFNTFEVWLCDVTKFVFGNFPENIWIVPINN